VREACSSEDLVTGLDGATLVVLTETRTDVREAATLADAIRRSLERPIQAAGHEIYPGVSLGIARWSDTDARPEDLLQDAVAALHHARGPAGRRHALFEPSMRQTAAEMLELENDLRRALQRREIEVFYQPISNLAGGGIAGFEALARWRHPRRGLLPPISFIPAAESLGLIIGIDRVVAETACRQLRTWQVRYRQTPPLTMSVNVSSSQFMQPDLVPQLDLILRSAGVWGQSVTLEVTESVLMEDAQHAAAMLAQLRRLGMGISVDDFGTGYSSLAYLRRFEIDAVKIDRSFVARMLTDDDSLEIVRSVVSLARNLGTRTVAEGVETRSQLDRLRTLGVDQIQGMFVAAPLPAEAAEELLVRAAEGTLQLDDPQSASAPPVPG
jgi:EAL domain-containing protein (putative c-di-GMP-specific phosphodiesterase class I)